MSQYTDKSHSLQNYKSPYFGGAVEDSQNAEEQPHFKEEGSDGGKFHWQLPASLTYFYS